MRDSFSPGRPSLLVLRRRSLAILALLAVGGCGVGDQRTIKVLSTRDDSPIAGVRLQVRAVGKALGENGPEYDKEVWDLTTDEAGEVRVKLPAGTDLRVDLESGPAGYSSSIETVKYYEQQHSVNKGQPYIHYLTPQGDVAYERIRHAYRWASDVMNGKRSVASDSMVYLVNMYHHAKKHAKSEREIAALREFCRFEELVKAEAAKGWPTLGTTHYFVDWGTMLLDDCAADDPATAPDQPN